MSAVSPLLEMIKVSTQIRSIEVDPAQLPLDELVASGQPAVLKGLVRDWSLTKAAARSDLDAMSYLRSFYNGVPVSFSFGEPEIRGRPFHSQDFRGLNCEVRRARLDEVLAEIEQHLEDDPQPMIYVASLLVDSCLPGLREQNDLPLLHSSGLNAPPSIWIGTRTTASCHYDAPNNIACCVAGRRRFTLFPPEQIVNLYPGPLDPTPGGQAVSLVDFRNPDISAFPRFADALASGQAAEVEPGDAVFIPSMWWHHVEALGSFNTLVNYWWSSVPKFIPMPMNALYHAIWTIRDRPEREKLAWKNVFDYYVFGPSNRANEHIPEHARGVLGDLDEARARQLRAMLINKLNR